MIKPFSIVELCARVKALIRRAEMVRSNPTVSDSIETEGAANGTLSAAGSFPTGGVGSGDGLGNQGALILSDNKRWLYAVNAGSNDISVFAVAHHGPSPLSGEGGREGEI